MKKNERKRAAPDTKEVETLRQQVAQLEAIAGELRLAEDQGPHGWPLFPSRTPIRLLRQI